MRVWISKHTLWDIQTRVLGNQLAKTMQCFNKRLLTFHDKLLFAVSIYVYISVHEIYVYRAIREHC